MTLQRELNQITAEQLSARLLRMERSILRQERVTLEILSALKKIVSAEAGGRCSTRAQVALERQRPSEMLRTHMACLVSQPITNALTIDVEDYFQVSAFASAIDRRPVGHAGMPGRAQCAPHARPARAKSRRQGHVLHAGLDRRALPGAGPPHRGRWP